MRTSKPAVDRPPYIRRTNTLIDQELIDEIDRLDPGIRAEYEQEGRDLDQLSRAELEVQLFGARNMAKYRNLRRIKTAHQHDLNWNFRIA